MKATNRIKCFVTCLFAMVLMVESQSSKALYARNQQAALLTSSQKEGQQNPLSQKSIDGIWVGILETPGIKAAIDSQDQKSGRQRAHCQIGCARSGRERLGD